MTANAKTTAFDWIGRMQPEWSAWNAHIWDLAETAWREYRSSAWYVERLTTEGFTVERGSGGMPTAFSATWEPGAQLPTLAFGNYVDRDNPNGPFEACDINQVVRTRAGVNSITCAGVT